ncbi:MAG TPA: hypothetical protein VNQ76_14095 [Planctomicrobium sp.]|nr:hypothetical protein [Planctomicrobium sp.]
MKLTVQVTGEAEQRLHEFHENQVQPACHNLIRNAMIQSLQAIITENPVETGRSRAAWVEALQQLGGIPPAGWEGSHPTAIDDGRQKGNGTLVDGTAFTQATASNGVDYVRYLEYGTSRISPFAMVRRSLQRQREQLAGMFELQNR